MSFSDFLALTRLNKPIGIWLLLWPTQSALWLAAGGYPGLGMCLIFALGTVLMRSAGCVINDIWDRDFDRHVERTRNRPLTVGAVSVKAAVITALALLLAAAIGLLFLNRYAFYLALVAVLIAATYPSLKRFFPYPQAYLGVAFGMGIPMAFSALSDSPPVLVAWLLLGNNVLWTLAYDSQYALADKVDDLRLGLKSSVISSGRFDLALILFCLIAYVLAWLLFAWYFRLGVWFYPFWLGAWGHIFYQWRLIRGRDPKSCFRAFLSNHWLGAMLFAGIVVGSPGSSF